MPDLKTLLSSAARQQEPGRRPEFATLRDQARRRRRRKQVATGVTVVLVIGLAIGTIPFLRASDRPGDGDRTGGPPTARTTPAAATVKGRLLRVGGPAGTRPTGLLGEVRFQAEGGEIATARTADDGSFSIAVRPGPYVVTGTSPLFGAGKYVCRTEKESVEITTAGLDDLQVICNQR